MLRLVINPLTRLLLACIFAATVATVAHCRRSNTFASAAYGSPEGRADSTVVPGREFISPACSDAGANQSACGSLRQGDACACFRRESNTAADTPAHAAAPTAQISTVQ